jgi:hypothetical protein
MSADAPTKQLLVVILCALATPPVEAKAPRELLRDLPTADVRRVVTRVKQLPTPIRSAIAKAIGKRSLFMADAGRPFQDTDFVIVKPGYQPLPTRRLYFAFRTSRFFIVHYQAGGYERAAKTLVFPYPSSEPIRYILGRRRVGAREDASGIGWSHSAQQVTG